MDAVLADDPAAARQFETLPAAPQESFRKSLANVLSTYPTAPDSRRLAFVRQALEEKNRWQKQAEQLKEQTALQLDQGLRYLVLAQGERTQTDLTTGEKTLSHFSTARIAVGDAPDVALKVPEPRSMSTLDLLAIPTRQAQAELTWRIGLIWATFNMVLAGLSLAAGNTRRNSNWNLVYALLVFVVYFNLLSLSQSWVSKGKLEWISGLLLIHGGLTLGALFMIWWRDGAVLPGRHVSRRAWPATQAEGV